MASSNSSTQERRIKRANPSTIHDKFLVGYQGWFTCAGDGEPVGPGHHGWLHWFNFPIPDGGRPNTDLWPDVSSYSPSELFPVPGLKTKSNEQVFLFSSRNPNTVQRHFHWMAEHGVDGAFLQRFAGQTDLEAGNEGIRRLRDEVGDRVREAAEKNDRVFAIMYDVSGVPADRIARVLERDWTHLVHEKGVLDSPNYLKEKGKPVIALWGFGFDGAGHTPAILRSVIANFRRATPGGAYIMAGVPAQWRTSEGDADRNPEFVDVWLNEFDAISPWTIGRFSSEIEADHFVETKMKGDSDLLKKRVEEGFKKVDYIPVVFPGGSGYNLSEGKWHRNGIKRNGGRFLWKQIYNARKLGVRTMYGAMWDEYDEGTAFMPVVPHKRLLPQSDKFEFIALDEDGYDLPADWYMRICGFAVEVLNGERRVFETFPSKELQDYWSTRPKYEEIPVAQGAPVATGSGSGSEPANASGSAGNVIAGGSATDAAKPSGSGQTYEDWLASQNDEKEEAPPPPYSLEEESVPATTATAAGPTSATNISTAIPPNHNTSTIPSATGAAPIPGVSPTSPSHPSSDHNAPYTGQQPMNTSFGVTPDPVASLANDLGRVNVSSPRPNNSLLVPAAANPPTLFVPPPLHPTHPAASGQSAYGAYGRPSPVPSPRPTSAAAVGRPPQTNMNIRPTNAPSPVGGYPGTHLQLHPQHQQQQPESNASGPWSQGQWPPPEWKVNNNANSSSTSYAAYNPSGGQGGANLSRPQSFSAGQHRPTSSASANLRPSATIGHGAGPGGRRPSFSGPPGFQMPDSPDPAFPVPPIPNPGPPFPMAPSGYGAPGASSPYSAVTIPSPYGPPSPEGPLYPGQIQNPAYPPASSSPYPGPKPSSSPYPGQQSFSSAYPGQHTPYPGSAYPSQPSFPHQQPYQQHSSPPVTPGSGPIKYPSTTNDPSTSGPAGYHPNYQPPNSPHASLPHQYHGAPSPSASSQGVHFPYGPGGEYGHGYNSGGGTGPTFPGQNNGYGGYPNQQYGQHGGAPSGALFPQASSPGPGNPWMPGSSSSPPPTFPPPPRPNNYNRPNSSSGPGFPLGATSSSSSGAGHQALGLAMSAVNMVAGKKTGDKIGAALGKFTR